MKHKKHKKHRDHKKAPPISQIKIDIPEELEKYLDDKELLLLKCMMANYTIQDMTKHTEYNRANIMDKLIDLGRAIEAFELAERRIFPEDVPNASYLLGWNDCKRFIRRLINDKLNWRQTLKNRNT